MRLYYPHKKDAAAASQALNLALHPRLDCTGAERDALADVIYAAGAAIPVTQETICRAHDAIARMRRD